METITVYVDKDVNKEENYAQAVDMIKKGEVVAFPTETVYGLGADARNAEAVSKIYEAKGRPSDNPLIVHVDSKETALQYITNVSPKALRCMEEFWPGALTLVLEARQEMLAENVTSGLPTVAIRVPDHPVALNLLQRVKLPIAAPSANRSGKPSPTEAKHVQQDLEGKIPLILDGGETVLGLESTVLDLTSEPPVILRPGSITAEQLEKVIGKVRLAAQIKGDAPRSPGMKYTHYAPDAPVYLIENEDNLLGRAIDHLHGKGKKVAVLSSEPYEAADFCFPLQAETLYASLRKCDDTDVDLILAGVTKDQRQDAALMNRLEKAADYKWFS